MKKKRVILVHGFNVRDKGADTIDRLRPYFEDRGYEVIEAIEGFRFLIGVRLFNGRRAKKLASMIQPGDVLIGHSDGCNIITMACKLLAKRGGFPHMSLPCVFYNPALDKDTWQHATVKKVLVFHTRSDKPVLFSKFLPFHNWGEQGRIGYFGPQWYLHKNVEYDRLGFPGLEHSYIFSKPLAMFSTVAEFDNWID